jgi:4-hydroxybenzoate polyprenyltransferase
MGAWRSGEPLLPVNLSSCRKSIILLIKRTGPRNSSIDKAGALAVALSSTVFATTLHAQDFKDEEGDRLTGRRTLPTIFPKAARFSMMIGVPLWSYGLSCVWRIDALSTTAFVVYGAFVGTRFVLYDTVGADKQSCKYYSVSRNMTWVSR